MSPRPPRPALSCRWRGLPRVVGLAMLLTVTAALAAASAARAAPAQGAAPRAMQVAQPAGAQGPNDVAPGGADAPGATLGAPSAAGEPPEIAADEAPPRPLVGTDLVQMDFQDVDLGTLVKFISEITGRNFVVDEKVKGKVTVISPTRITVDEAYRVFQSVLQVKGFTTVDTGPVIKIIPTKDIKEAGGVDRGAGTDGSDAFVTRLVRLRFVDATDAASLLQPMVSRDGLISAYGPTNTLIVIDTAANLARVRQVIAELDVPGQERSSELIPLKHAYAGDLAVLLRDAIEDRAGGGGGSTSGTSSGGSGGTTLPAIGPSGAKPSSAAGSRSGRQFRIIPDERANSLLVIGNPLEIRQVLDLVRRLDVPPSKGSGRVQVYRLKYANAAQMVQVLANIVGLPTAGGGAAQPFSRGVTTGGGRFGSAAGGFAPGGTQTSSPLTGSPVSSGLSTGLGQQRGFNPSTAPFGGGGNTVAAAGTGPAIQFDSGVRVTADPSTNSVVISASPSDYETLVEVIQRLDVPRRQVSVEAIVFEVSLDHARSLGIEFQAGTNFGDQAVGLARTNLNGAIGTLNDSRQLGSLTGLLAAIASEQKVRLPDGREVPAQVALLTALQSDRDVNVLSAPNLLTTDNEEAQIVVGQNVPFLTGRSTDTANLANTFNSIDRRDVGITLRLTPQISDGGTVRLLIFQEVSDLIEEPVAVVQANGPTTTVRSASTSVVVPDGQTVAIGGLISDNLRNTERKVPYLGDVPVLGNFFRFEDKANKKQNLIILLTPRIVRQPDVLESLTDEDRSRFRQALRPRGSFAGTVASVEAARRREERRQEQLEKAVPPGDAGLLLPAEAPWGEPPPAPGRQGANLLLDGTPPRGAETAPDAP